MIHIKSFEEIPTRGVALLDLQNHHCRFPLKDEPGFCGAPRLDHSSYCGPCHARAYRGASGSRSTVAGRVLDMACEAVAPAREAMAPRIAAEAIATHDAGLPLDKFVRAAKGRFTTRVSVRAPVAIQQTEPKPSENEAADIEKNNEDRLAQIKMKFIAVQTPQAIINQLPRIMDEVAKKHGISVTDIKSARRSAPIVRARQEFFYRARHETMKSYPAIAQFCGGRDHTSGIWAVRQYEARMRGEKLKRACHLPKDQAK